MPTKKESMDTKRLLTDLELAWVAQKSKEGALDPKKPSGRVPKITEDRLPLLEKIIAKNNDKTLPELYVIWKNATGIEVSETVIRWAMKKLHYTREKKQWSPSSKNPREHRSSEIVFTVFKND